MSVKLVIGLTDTLSNSIFSVSSNPYTIASSLMNVTHMTAGMTRDSYNLLLLPNTVEHTTIEWELNTNLPAVAALLNMIDVIKTRPYFAKVITDTRKVVGSYKDVFSAVEFVNVIPNREIPKVFYTEEDNNAVVTTEQEFGVLELDSLLGYEYQSVTENETLTYAFKNDDLSMLRKGPINRMVTPRFVFSFFTAQSTNPSTQMNILQQSWMKNHKDELEALGYKIDDPTSKIGALPIGRLIGDPQEQYNKILQFGKICKVNIIRD
jgi:hypothetical protein